MSDALLEGASVISTSDVLVDFLRKRPEVRSVLRGLLMGTVTQRDVEVFVAQVLREFQPGTRLPGDVALSALATAFIAFGAPFATRYLNELASLSASELPMSRRVAARVLAERTKLLGQATTVTIVIAMPLLDGPPAIERPTRISSGVSLPPAIDLRVAA